MLPRAEPWPARPATPRETVRWCPHLLRPALRGGGTCTLTTRAPDAHARVLLHSHSDLPLQPHTHVPDLHTHTQPNARSHTHPRSHSPTRSHTLTNAHTHAHTCQSFTHSHALTPTHTALVHKETRGCAVAVRALSVVDQRACQPTCR